MEEPRHLAVSLHSYAEKCQFIRYAEMAAPLLLGTVAQSGHDEAAVGAVAELNRLKGEHLDLVGAEVKMRLDIDDISMTTV